MRVFNSLLQTMLAPFMIAFVLLYGLLTDGFMLILHVKVSECDVSTKKLMVAMTFSTAITG